MSFDGKFRLSSLEVDMERRNVLKVLGLAAAAGAGFVPDAAEAAEKTADENNYQLHTFSVHQMNRNEIAEVLSGFIFPGFRNNRKNNRKLVSGKPIEIWFYNEDGSPWGQPDVYGRYSAHKECKFTLFSVEPKAKSFEGMLARIERIHASLEASSRISPELAGLASITRRDPQITAMVRFFTEPR